MLTRIKKKVQSWVLTEAKVAHRIGLTPNQITVAGTFFATVSGMMYWLAGTYSFEVSLWRTLLFLGPVFLLISGFCDALDGALARVYGKVTVFGGFIDSLLDRYAEAAIYLGIIMGGFSDVSWGIIALAGSLLVSYTRTRSEMEGVKMETIGVAERAERLLIITIGSLVNLLWLDSLRWSMVLLALLTNFTVVQRVNYFYRRTKP